jgi:hypothetical protein
MSCEKLRNGLQIECGSIIKNYYQQVVLINRQDVLNKQILTSRVSINDEYDCRYKLIFNLKEGLSGFRFSSSQTGSTIFGVVEKTTVQGIPQYMHSVTIVVAGVSQQVKCTLQQLDNADYFCALQLYDGTVEIYGLQNGLTTGDFTYDVQEGGGGTAIVLSSLETAPESLVPLVYKSLVPGSETADFDSNFSNIAIPISV